jgi:hypothetical protein
MTKLGPADPDQHGFAEFKRFAEDFKSESDRAAVILGAAKLDMMLFQILQARLIACASGKDELLEGDNPLSTFSARINIAFRLGIITSELARALHLVRRIRNALRTNFPAFRFRLVHIGIESANWFCRFPSIRPSFGLSSGSSRTTAHQLTNFELRSHCCASA